MRSTLFRIISVLWVVILLSAQFTTTVSAQTETPPQKGDEEIQIPYKRGTYVVSQGPHGQSYGDYAVDLAGGQGEKLYSPITGVVTGKYTDSLGNPTLIIENSVWTAKLLHGSFEVDKGDRLEIGQFIGREGNFGNVICFDDVPPNGRSCGYHTHFNVFSKRSGQNVNPLDVSQVGYGPFLESSPTKATQLSFGDYALPALIILGVVILLVVAGGLIVNPKATSKTVLGTARIATWTAKSIFRGIKWSFRQIYLAKYWFGSLINGVTMHERGEHKKVRLTGCCAAMTLSFMLICSAVSLVVLDQVPLDRAVWNLPKLVEYFSHMKFEWPEIAWVEGSIPLVKIPTEIDRNPIEADPPLLGERVTAKVSHYWPPLGGYNCSKFTAGKCVARMASGLRWQDWVDRAVACPAELPFGTKVYAFGQEWICQDRGGMIVREGSVYWFDFLTEKSPAPYGSYDEVIIVRP